jgi:prepilin-type N-terminal cleavage/methylation domain-containing protein
MKRFRRTAFTLMEILVAISVLALVTVASLRLVIIGGRTLGEVREQRKLLDYARETQVKILEGSGRRDARETNGSWETREETRPVFGGKWSLRYRTLTVEQNGRSIVVYVPFQGGGKVGQ